VEDGVCRGIETVSGWKYLAKAVILCTGTYLKARCVYGEVSDPTGPNGLKAATHLSDSLRECGIDLLRFKTGTPARIDGRTVDFSKMTEQKGDDELVPFSFTNRAEDIEKPYGACLKFWVFDAEFRQSLLYESAHLTHLTDSRQVAFHISHEARLSNLAEALSYHLQSDGLACARSSCNKSMAVCHLRIDINIFFP
jgi:tRNA U34 5-carboxymethylaminomethyl modifying enzyme MnmG/GidA